MLLWVISPVVTDVVPDWGTLRYPKVSRIVDPGRAPKAVRHTSVISSGLTGEQNDWCLSLVEGFDLSRVVGDPEIIDLFEEALSDRAVVSGFLEATPRMRNYSPVKVARIGARLASKQVDLADLSADSKVAEWLDRIAFKIHRNHGGVRGL